MGQKNKVCSVVGVVDSLRAGREAAGLVEGDVDLLEWRADCLPGARRLPGSRFPWILTVRDPQEGGRGGLSLREREARFLSMLEGAAMVDVELRSLRGLRRVVAEAGRAGVRVIGSFHDFRATPKALRLREVVARGEDAGVDVIKVAALAEGPSDISRLLEVFELTSLPVAVMGMGPLGFASRLLFAECGSVLNYGWLDRPNVAGQWSALALKQMLRFEAGRPA